MPLLTNLLDALCMLPCQLQVYWRCHHINGGAQVSFHAPEGASTAMQLFMGQATRLSHALQDGALSPAWLCSFFTVLGAMPQCLKAEADAILAMLRSARETDQQQGGEADPDTDAGGRLEGVISAIVLQQVCPPQQRLRDGMSVLMSLKSNLPVVIWDAA